jgi:hypothetical protein
VGVSRAFVDDIAVDVVDGDGDWSEADRAVRVVGAANNTLRALIEPHVGHDLVVGSKKP